MSKKSKSALKKHIELLQTLPLSEIQGDLQISEIFDAANKKMRVENKCVSHCYSAVTSLQLIPTALARLFEKGEFYAISNMACTFGLCMEYPNDGRANKQGYSIDAKILPDANLKGYKESFRFFDRSGKGYITADDFRRALTQIQDGRPPTPEEVADLMREYDINGDGKVTFEELVVITVKRRDGYDVDKKSQMKAMFKQFDKNENDALDKDELADLVKAMGKNLFGTNENKILEDFDDNKDGKLQYREFVNFMKKEDTQKTNVLGVTTCQEETQSS